MRALVWIMASFWLSLSQAQDFGDLCQGIFCPHGRMCVPHQVGSRQWTTCGCPASCPNDNAPVCTYYNVEFSNACEMHKFACEHELSLRVKNAGACGDSSLDVCPEWKLLGFPNRYLDWLMIARGMSNDPSYKVTLRGQSLNKKERTDVLLWEFLIIDKNRNNKIDEEEADNLLGAILRSESCIYGFIKSCDQNGDNVIEFREWIGCFPAGESDSSSVGSRL